MAVHKCNKEKEISEVTVKMAEIYGDIKLISQNVAFIKEAMVETNKDIENTKKEIAKNSEFRIKANGIVGGIAFICSGVGAGLVWLFMKVFGGSK